MADTFVDFIRKRVVAAVEEYVKELPATITIRHEELPGKTKLTIEVEQENG